MVIGNAMLELGQAQGKQGKTQLLGPAGWVAI